MEEGLDACRDTRGVDFQRANSVVAITRARPAAAMRASSASSFSDDASRETWTWRSTVGAYSDDDNDSDNNQERWSDDDIASEAEEKSEDNNNNSAYSSSTDDNDDASYYQQRSSNQQDDGQESRARRAEREAKKPVASQAAAPKLLSIAGFSNKEALKSRLPVRRSAPTPSQPSSTQRSKQKQQLQQQHGDPRTLENDRLVLKKRQHQFSQPQQLLPEQDDLQAQGKNLEHKIAMHEELTRMDKKLTNEALSCNSNMLLPQVDLEQRPAVTYRMSTVMVYCIVFTSSATLHCAIFNFSLELRRFFRLEMLPFGVFLLVCWAILGLLSFAGGWIGDLVRDRVVLLRRSAVLWALAVFVLHIAAFRAGSTFSIVLLSLALPCSCAAHGIFAPNCIVLGAEKYNLLNDRRHLRATTRSRRSQLTSSSQTLVDDTDADIDIVSKCDQARLDNDDNEALLNHLNATRKMAIHKYFSRCFGATLAGSSWVQLFFFLLVDVEVPSSGSSPTKKSIMGRRGFLCMLSSSLLLLVALVCFVFQSRSHFQPPRAPVGSFERKLESLDEKPKLFSWRAVLRVFSRAFIGYVFLVSLLVAFVGVCCAFFGLVVVADTSFNVRLASFFMILLGWHTAMSISKFQLSANGKLSNKCRSLGIPMPQLQSALLLVFFFCMSSLSAFLRAQLYTTLVVQVCQTRLDIPGAGKLFNPNALGALVSIVSLLLIPISNAARIRGGRRRKAHQREFRVVSISPSRRLSIGICLYLVGIFLSSIVELYRRTKVVLSDPQPTCSKAYSDFGFLWAAPHLVFLGLSDMVFRVSLQEQFHSINLLTSRWPGFMQGVIEFSEMIGYVGALALTSMLSSWLFRPSSSDLALVLLLMTTLLAFSYASLKRVAEKIAAGHLGETGGLG